MAGAGLNQGNLVVSQKPSKIMPVDTGGALPGGRTRVSLGFRPGKFCQKNKHTLSQLLSFHDPHCFLFCRCPRREGHAKDY
jgi:hypothetical protein